MKDTRIALAVIRCPVGDIEQNLDCMDRWAAESRRRGAEIVCFPEMNASGYKLDEALLRVAQPIDGRIVQEIARIAAATGITILAGMAERGHDGRLFASHVVANPAGPAGVYRKLHIAPPEKRYLSPGDSIPIFSMPGFAFGIQLCFDAHFPELSTAMALNGADVVFMPHASPNGTPAEKLDSWMRHLSARAFDNGLFIAACNQRGDNGKSIHFPGVAVVIGPDGKILRQYVGDEDGLLLVDLKTADLDQVRKHRMRYFLPHHRKDLFNLEAQNIYLDS